MNIFFKNHGKLEYIFFLFNYFPNTLVMEIMLLFLLEINQSKLPLMCNFEIFVNYDYH